MCFRCVGALSHTEFRSEISDGTQALQNEQMFVDLSELIKISGAGSFIHHSELQTTHCCSLLSLVLRVTDATNCIATNFFIHCKLEEETMILFKIKERPS